jgi:hypothetical protein
MTARNPITGDLIQTKAATREYLDGHFRIFGESKVQKGRYKQDKETGKFIPAHEWERKYGDGIKRSKLLFTVKDFDAFESPATGKVVRNYREREYDLKSSGCREYEGFRAEKTEADKYLQQEDARLEHLIGETVEETAYQIEHGYVNPTEDAKVQPFTFGD